MDYTSLNARLVTMLKRKFPRRVKSVMGLRYLSLDIHKSEPPYVSYRRQDEHKDRHATVRYPKQFERILDTL